MVWRQGAYEEEDSTERPAPWRAAVPDYNKSDASEVVVEAWDDELKTPSRADELAAAARRGGAHVGPATRRVLNLVLFALAIFGAAAGVAVAWMHVMGDPLADAHAYYEAASRLNAGRPLYPENIDPNSNQIYLYPPLLAIALRPLAILPFEWFALIWELVIIGSFAGLVRYLGVRRKSTWIAIGILGIPIGWALAVAQAHVPLTMLLAFGQPWSIAIAANLKLTPVLIAIWWLGRREWEAFFAFLVWTVLLVLAQVLLAPDASFAYFQSIGFEEVGEVRNISPYELSPVLWAALLIAGAVVTLALARTRWGWAAAVTFATLAPPRLLIYMLMGLLAAVRQPRSPSEPDPDTPVDAATAYGRSIR
jgi:Glycosyltransferase family 87